MYFDFRRIRHYLAKYSNQDYAEEEIHDGFVRYLSTYIKGIWPGCEIYRGVKLIDVDKKEHGRPDLIALGEDFLGIVEAKVIRKGHHNHHKIKAWLNYSREQLTGYSSYCTQRFGVNPRCYAAIKHRKQNSFEFKEISVDDLVERNFILH